MGEGNPYPQLVYVSEEGGEVVRCKTLLASAAASVATTQVMLFAIFGNILFKITKIFEGLDPIKSRWVLCQL